jgi:propanol-preferring alcohol dehydrogenase
VGRGWCGGYCFECKPCRMGQFISCQKHFTTGLNFDGGWAEYMAARWESLVKIPDGMSSEQAGPLLCAGVTTFNSIRNMKLTAGSWVAVQGVGGLGHLAVQYAKAMGYRVVVLSTSADKAEFAKQLGAEAYVDSSKQEVVPTLMKLTGGLGVGLVVSTTPSGKAMASVLPALAPQGTLLTLGASPDPIPVFSGLLIGKIGSVRGWASGSPNDSEECLEFSHHFGIKVLTETFALEKAGEAYEAMNANKVRFRAVVLPGKAQ